MVEPARYIGELYNQHRNDSRARRMIAEYTGIITSINRARQRFEQAGEIAAARKLDELAKLALEQAQACVEGEMP